MLLVKWWWGLRPWEQAEYRISNATQRICDPAVNVKFAEINETEAKFAIQVEEKV